MANTNVIGISLTGIAALIVLIIIVAFLSFTKSKKEKIRKLEEKSKSNVLTIDTILGIVNDKATSRDELFFCVRKVIKDFPFPPKQNAKVTREGEKYLNFVTAIARHKNASAKLIAFMDTELKKQNPHYTREIEMFENNGLNLRR